MAPRTEEQFEEIREGKKALIMDVAMELFANVGYHPTSISEITKKAGISKGLLYNYFESKEDLLTKIMAEGFEKMLIIFDPDNDGNVNNEEMSNFITDFFVMLQKNNNYWKLYYAVLLQPKVYKLFASNYEKLIMKFMGMLTGYYASHGAKNPEQEAMIFGALLDGIAFNCIINPDLFPVEDFIKNIKEKFCYLNNK